MTRRAGKITDRLHERFCGAALPFIILTIIVILLLSHVLQ